MQLTYLLRGMLKALKNVYSRKPGNAGEVDEAMGMLAHQKSRLQHISTEGGFLLW